MGRRTGSADLPLHGGRVPHWLAARMARLGRVIVEAIVLEYGRDECLRRLAHPFWFQAFGAVMGMDWHSSGITTSVMGALKRGLAPAAGELGIHVCGGRGRHSRRTPDELLRVGERTGVDGDALGRASRLVAKVDGAAVQDGFALYLHSFVVTDDGRWAVVQQGMNPDRRQARRYHWLSEGLESFVDAPHAAIDGPNQGRIVNLTDRRAAAARRCQVALACGGPDRVLAALRRELPLPFWDAAATTAAGGAAATRGAREHAGASEEPADPAIDPVAAVAALGLPDGAAAPLPHLQMPARHDVRASDVVLRRLRGALAAAADRGPADFADLLLVPGIGARTVEALALVSEVVYGAPCRFTDPARFSLAHGGKDGHPFPVPLRVYDETIGVLRAAVARARLGRDETLAALRRLDRQARALERVAAGPALDALIARERARAPAYGGRTVHGPVRAQRPSRDPQLRLL
jgi:uncharacterized protein